MHLLPACRFLQNRDDTHFDDTYLIKENQDVEKKIIKSFFFFFKLSKFIDRKFRFPSSYDDTK